MDNKKRKTHCLNCEHSYRGKDGVLKCHKGHYTSVSYYDCKNYMVFLEDKEDLYRMYKVVENLKPSDNSDFKAHKSSPKRCPECGNDKNIRTQMKEINYCDKCQTGF